MIVRRLFHWRILLPTVAVSFLVLSITQASGHGISRSSNPPMPTGTPDEQASRLQTAEQAENMFLAATPNPQIHRVLISFDGSADWSNGLGKLRQSDPEINLIAMHYSIIDSVGTRHSITISRREGEDLELTAVARLAFMVGHIREIARKQLEVGQGDSSEVEGSSGNGCPGISDEGTCEALVAQSEVTEDQATLDGITVLISDQGLRTLLDRKDEFGILAAETSQDGRLTSPIVAGGE